MSDEERIGALASLHAVIEGATNDDGTINRDTLLDVIHVMIEALEEA